MTEQEFVAIVCSVRPIEGADLDLPVRDTVLDSLDLATLRSTLEVRGGRPIEDRVRAGAATLRQLLETLP